MNKNVTPNKASEANTENVDLLELYREQTVVEGKHDDHIDGYTYGDYSDSCCC